MFFAGFFGKKKKKTPKRKAKKRDGKKRKSNHKKEYLYFILKSFISVEIGTVFIFRKGRFIHARTRTYCLNFNYIKMTVFMVRNYSTKSFGSLNLTEKTKRDLNFFLSQNKE